MLHHALSAVGVCRARPAASVQAQLTRFKGVGPKSAACVLMFCMRRKEFPVDTHVWHISKVRV